MLIRAKTIGQTYAGWKVKNKLFRTKPLPKSILKSNEKDIRRFRRIRSVRLPMRSVTIPAYNSKTLEVFLEKRDYGCEVWTVGVAKGERVIIDHFRTRDDLQARLEYAQHEDLIWRDAAPLEMPSQRHKLAIEREESFKRGVFEHGTSGVVNSIRFLDRDRKDTTTAKRAIHGQWADGVLTFSIEPLNKLRWSCADSNHWLNRGSKSGRPAPNWWNLSGLWELHLMNNDKLCGTHVGIIHVDEKELHFRGGVDDRIALVFRRQPNTALEPTPTAP